MPAKKISAAETTDKMSSIKKTSPKTGTRSSARIVAALITKENIKDMKSKPVNVKPAKKQPPKKPLVERQVPLESDDSAEKDEPMPDADSMDKPIEAAKPAKKQPAKKPVPLNEIEPTTVSGDGTVADGNVDDDEPMADADSKGKISKVSKAAKKQPAKKPLLKEEQTTDEPTAENQVDPEEATFGEEVKIEPISDANIKEKIPKVSKVAKKQSAKKPLLKDVKKTDEPIAENQLDPEEKMNIDEEVKDEPMPDADSKDKIPKISKAAKKQAPKKPLPNKVLTTDETIAENQLDSEEKVTIDEDVKDEPMPDADSKDKIPNVSKAAKKQPAKKPLPNKVQSADGTIAENQLDSEEKVTIDEDVKDEPMPDADSKDKIPKISKAAKKQAAKKPLPNKVQTTDETVAENQLDSEEKVTIDEDVKDEPMPDADIPKASKTAKKQPAKKTIQSAAPEGVVAEDKVDPDDNMAPETIVVAFEVCKSCHRFALQANNLFKELNDLVPTAVSDKKFNLELTINEKAPRRGAFEISIYRKKLGEDSTEIWTGIKKGPPRKEKYPEAANVMQRIVEYVNL